MLWKPTQLIAVTAVLILAACSKPESETASEPQSADEAAPTAESLPESPAAKGGGTDPTVVNPGHYKAEFDNEAVRILRINYGAGEESAMHAHPDSVAVFLSDIKAQMTMPDGSTDEVEVAAGDASFNAAGEHRVKNISDSAWEVVEVELKPRDAGQGESGGPDATVVDADHYTMETENESVRIVRIAYGAGEESVMHYHPDSVAVFVTDHLVQMTMPDGSTDEIAAKAGDAIFIPGGQHLPKNISDSAWELVLIELKD